MHFEILVEDQSGKRALDILVPEIIGAQSTLQCDCIPRSWPQWAEENLAAGGTDISVCANACWGEKPDLPVLVKTQGASLIKR